MKVRTIVIAGAVVTGLGYAFLSSGALPFPPSTGPWQERPDCTHGRGGINEVREAHIAIVRATSNPVPVMHFAFGDRIGTKPGNSGTLISVDGYACKGELVAAYLEPETSGTCSITIAGTAPARITYPASNPVACKRVVD